MASKSHKYTDRAPSPEEEAHIKDVCRKLRDYLRTPEGERVGEELMVAMEKWRKIAEPKPPQLTVAEEKAFRFIKEQLLLKKPITVRDVAWSAGLKSSRSGANLINRLIVKGLLVREGKGRLSSIN